MKIAISVVLMSVLAAGGVQSLASPGETESARVAPEVELLSAKIENAIAELPEESSEESIQNATFFVLAKQDSPLETKITAIGNVIERAQTIGDQKIVDALEQIDLGLGDSAVAKGETAQLSVESEDKATSFPAPPSTGSKGGSDY